MIVIRFGDIFKYEHQSLAHGVNALGKMGAGIAVEFRKRYPNMYRRYREKCKKHELKPGDLLFYRFHSLPDVFNLVTQKNLKAAREEYLEQAVQKLYMKAKKESITDIAMPEIGCGLGGLSPDFLRKTLNKYFNPSNINITVYQQQDRNF